MCLGWPNTHYFFFSPEPGFSLKHGSVVMLRFHCHDHNLLIARKMITSWLIFLQGSGFQMMKTYSTTEITWFSAENFKASEGWLHNFKKRHSIRQLSIQGERMSADHSALSSFSTACNRDWLGLGSDIQCWWNRAVLEAASKQNASSCNWTDHWAEKSKDWITFLACANASGTHKLKLSMIGKSALPPCFKHVNTSLLPLFYQSQKKDWRLPSLRSGSTTIVCLRWSSIRLRRNSLLTHC